MTLKTSQLLVGAMILVSASTVIPMDVQAQADTLLKLETTGAAERFRVDSTGGFVARGKMLDGGNTNVPGIPATGAGTRFMWYPERGMVRWGRAVGNEWDQGAIDDFSFAGGNNVRASGYGSFSYGDQVNVSSTVGVGFGSGVTVSGTAGFSAGASNICSGFACTAIGYTTRAGGQGSVALGYRTSAMGDYSVAIGYRATTLGYTGAIVIGDESSTDSVRASANNQFTVRAGGGVRFFTNAVMTSGVTLNANGSSWNVVSDRNRKENFQVLDGEDVLSRLRSVPVSSWNYISEGKRVRHIGPMAQDWHAAFGLNEDNVTINMSDLDGVNLLAAQALEQRTVTQAEEIASLRSEVAILKERQAAMEKQQAELLQLVEAALKKQ